MSNRSSAGSGGRNAIGTSVLGGTISGTVLGSLFVPLFFVLVTRRRKTKPEDVKMPAEV